MDDSFITALGYVASVLGALLVLFGGLTLLANWFRPQLLGSRLFSPGILGRFKRTKRNITVVASWYASLGLYMAMAPFPASILRLASLAVALGLMFPALRVLGPGREA